MSVVIQCSDVWKQYARQAYGIKELFVGKNNSKEANRYSREWALCELSFNVERGSAFGIIGHNGAGKSTLLSLLLGTILPDRGNIKMHGRIASLLELGAGFHPELNGRENIRLYGSILGLSLKEIREKEKNIIEFSELGDAIEQPIRTYSNGMVTRLGFSTIIHTPSDILLIDEVLAVGDSSFRQKTKTYLNEFLGNDGTLVIVSHELDVLSEVCDSGICLDMGKIVESGSITDVVNFYTSTVENNT